MNKPKKLQIDFLTKFTLMKKFWVRAHAKPYLAMKIQKSSNFGLGGRIFYRRARQKYFCHRIVHKILHLPDILNVFISLELVAVDVFEIHDFS